jgi:hypothetical protein
MFSDAKIVPRFNRADNCPDAGHRYLGEQICGHVLVGWPGKDILASFKF